MEIYFAYFSSVSSMLFQHGETGTEKGINLREFMKSFFT
jgi:hypothetical protein